MHVIIWAESFPNYNRAQKWSKKNGTLSTDIIVQLHPTWPKTWVKYSFKNGGKYIPKEEPTPVKKKAKLTLDKKKEKNTIAEL